MKSTFKKFTATFLSFVVAMQPVFAASANYTHRQYVQDLRVTGSNTNPGGNPNDPNNSGDTSGLILSTDTLNFSPLDVGTESSLQVLITNQGSPTPLNIQTGEAVFAATHNCPTTLNTGDSCTVSVRFAPNSGLNYTAFLSIQALTGTAKKVSLSGQGLGAVLSVNPKNLNFDDTYVGANQIKAITVTNTGNKAAIMGSPSFEGNTYTTADNYCSGSLDIGQSCNISVKFTPLSSGTSEGTMYLNANTGAGNTTAAVALLGAGLESGINLPKTVDFESVELGTTSLKSISIVNKGVNTLNISAITFSNADFTSTGCIGTLAPGAMCRLPVEFTPTQLGTYEVTLTVVETQKSYTSTINAVGTQTAVAVATPDTLEFGNVTVGTPSNPQIVTLKNTGNALLKYNRFTTSEGFQGESNCPGYLAPSESCTFSVWANAVKNGAMTKMLTIYTNVGPQLVQLKGQASGGTTDLLLSAESLNFESVDALTTSAAKSVLIKNTSAVASSIISITSSAAFPVTTSCADILGPNEECAVSATFTPQLAKFYGGAIVISTNTGSSSISLQGNGIAPQLSVTPEGLDFGNISGMTTVEPQILSVRSKGGKTVSIAGISVSNPAFTQTNNCGATLDDGKNCYITVVVNPSTEGAISGQLTVQSDSLEPIAPISLSAANKTYVAQVTPSIVDFASVSTSSTEKTPYDLTVKNVGVANMTLNGISPLSDYVKLKASNCTNIAPQASCTLSLELYRQKPTTLNQVFKTAGAGANAEFTVKATVQGVSARWIKSGVDFGYVPVGSSAQQTIMLGNKGNVTADLSGIQLTSSAFTVDASSCTSVEPQKNCNVTIGFAPTASGTYSATVAGVSTANSLTWEGDALNVQGNSVLKRISSSTNNLDVGLIKQGQVSQVQTVNFINDGDVSLSNVSVTSPLGINVTTNCPATLAVGATCSASVSADSAVLNKPEGVFTSNVTIRASGATTPVAVTGYITQDLTIKASTSANTVLPVTLDFGRVDLGTQKSLNFFVTAKGSAGKLVASASISGANAQEFTWTKVAKIVPTGSIESSCGAQITGSSFSNCAADAFTAGQSSTTASALSLSLTMTAATPTGARNASLTLSYNDGTQEVIPLTAVVPSLAKVSLSTDKLQFSPTDANTTSQLTIRLTNTGAEPLVISSAPYITGSTTFTFPAGGGTTCTGSIAVGAYCDTTVNFKPTDNTSSSGSLTFETSDYLSPAVVPLTGTGLQGMGSITVQGGGSSNFGGVTLGTTAKKVFMFNNVGNKAVTGVYPELAGAPASVTIVDAESTCGTVTNKASVGGGANCLITVAYNASTQGDVLSGVSLTVYSTAQNNPVSTAIQGFANGTWSVSVTDTSDVAVTNYDFGSINVGSNSSYTVKIKNTGTAPLNVTSAPSVSGNAAYTSSNTCGTSIAVGANCTATVVFAPTTAPEVTATLSVTTGAGVSSVSFKGKGIPPSASFVATSNYDFGTVYVSQSATKNFTLTNTGGVSLSTLTSAITDPAITIQSTTCPASIAPAASCTVVLKYAPTAVGSIGANVVQFKLTAFSAGDVTITPASTITGTAATATGSLTGVSGAFGTVYIGSNATKVYTFKATGTASLTGVYASMRSGSSTYFAITANTCGTSASPITLASNATCSVTVRYAPGAAGNHTGNLDLTSSATNSPSTVAFTGTSMADQTISTGGLTYGIANAGGTGNAATAFAWCDGTVLGQTGWRVPTYTELRALGTYISSQGGTSYMTAKGWPWSGTLLYWSSTVYSGSTYYAIVLPGTVGEARGVTQSAAMACVK